MTQSNELDPILSGHLFDALVNVMEGYSIRGYGVQWRSNMLEDFTECVETAFLERKPQRFGFDTVDVRTALHLLVGANAFGGWPDYDGIRDKYILVPHTILDGKPFVASTGKTRQFLKEFAIKYGNYPLTTPDLVPKEGIDN